MSSDGCVRCAQGLDCERCSPDPTSELVYLREFCERVRSIAESGIEGATVDEVKEHLFDYATTEAGKHRPWAKRDPWAHPNSAPAPSCEKCGEPVGATSRGDYCEGAPEGQAPTHSFVEQRTTSATPLKMSVGAQVSYDFGRRVFAVVAGSFTCKDCGEQGNRTWSEGHDCRPCASDASTMTVREAARRRIPLGVAEVQALEGALTQADEEIAMLRRAMGWAEGRGSSRAVVIEAVARLAHLSDPGRSPDYATNTKGR